MSNIPIRDGGTRPESYNLARKKRNSIKTTPSLTETPKYSGRVGRQVKDAESALEAATARLADKEAILERKKAELAAFQASGDDTVKKSGSQYYAEQEAYLKKEVSKANQKVKKYRDRVKEYIKDLAAVKKGLPTAAQERKNAERNKLNVVKTDKGTVTITRRAATDGGTYSTFTPKGNILPTEIRGGSNVAGENETLLKTTQDTKIKKAVRAGVPAATINKEINAFNAEQQRKAKLVEREQYIKISKTFAEDYVTKRDEYEQAVNTFNAKLLQSEADLFNAYAPLGFIYEPQKRVKNITFIDKEFYTLEGQKQALGRVKGVYTSAKAKTQNLGISTINTVRTGVNVLLPEDKKLPYLQKVSLIDNPNATALDRLADNPVFIFGAPAAYAVAATSVPILGAVVETGAIGVAGGVASVYTIQKAAEKVIYKDEFTFKEQNPYDFEQARKYALQELQKDTNAVTSFFNLDTTLGGRKKFVEYGTDYLQAAGYTGKELQAGSLALSAQAGTQQAQEVTFLLNAELFGEGFGGFSLTGSAFRTSSLLVPDKAVEATVAKNVFKRALTIDLKQAGRSTYRVITGGAAEGGAAVGAGQYIQNRQLDPFTTVLGVATGAATAGGFEFLRTSVPINPKTGTSKGRALLTTAANIVEPQEFLTDTTLTGLERFGGMLGRRTRRLDLLDNYNVVRTGVNSFDIQPKPKAFTASPAVSYTQTPTRSDDRLKSFSKDFSKTSPINNQFDFTKTQSKSEAESLNKEYLLMQSASLTKSNTENNVLLNSITQSKTDALTKAESLAKSETKTRTRTLTPPLLLPPLQGGSASFNWYGKKRSRSKKGYSTSIAASLFGNAYKAIGAKSTEIGVVSGLGVRF